MTITKEKTTKDFKFPNTKLPNATAIVCDNCGFGISINEIPVFDKKLNYWFTNNPANLIVLDDDLAYAMNIELPTPPKDYSKAIWKK